MYLILSFERRDKAVALRARNKADEGAHHDYRSYKSAIPSDFQSKGSYVFAPFPYRNTIYPFSSQTRAADVFPKPAPASSKWNNIYHGTVLFGKEHVKISDKVNNDIAYHQVLTMVQTLTRPLS